jgi:uncharacterized caspase-like protein
LKLNLDTFEDQARDADLALVYFSGHGSTFENQSYLVPSDAIFDELRRAERSVIPVEDVLESTASVDSRLAEAALIWPADTC